MRCTKRVINREDGERRFGERSNIDYKMGNGEMKEAEHK